VVKNVTGYDLCKLLAGSWGTLAVMTEVTLKVMPRAESERTVLLRGLDDLAANQAMTAALGSPFDVSGAAHLTGSALRTTQGPLGELAGPDQSVTLLRLEGISVSAKHRAASLAAALASFGAAEIVEDGAAAVRRCPDRAIAQTRQCRRWPCHADPGTGAGAPRRRCVPSAGGGAGRARRAGAAQF
jgi:glycolate oxidase FAD binding subunit